MTIGEVARRSGFTIKALRFYERRGLLPPSGRSAGKYRLYSRSKDPKTGKRRNLGTFDTREQAVQHERAVHFFERRNFEITGRKDRLQSRREIGDHLNDEIGLLRAAGVKEIVSLLDERNKGDAPWVLKEAVWSQLYGFRVTRFPMRSETMNPALIQQVVDYLRTRPGPVYVHGFLTDKRVNAVYDAARGMPAGTAVPPPQGN